MDEIDGGAARDQLDTMENVILALSERESTADISIQCSYMIVFKTCWYKDTDGEADKESLTNRRNKWHRGYA